MPKARSKSAKADSGVAADDAVQAPDAVPFETAIERLEGLVGQLEDGELDLEASLGAFEEGVSLSKQCAGQLEAAERRIEVLMREGGDWVARPFEDAEASDEQEGDEG